MLRETAREIVGSDGITVVLREAERCFYAAEDSASPLFKGMRFPMDACVSGWAITHRETVAISDIWLDDRVPQAVYAQTFVRSMVMVPVGSPEPVAAIGAYRADVREAEQGAIKRLEALGRAAGIACCSRCKKAIGFGPWPSRWGGWASGRWTCAERF